MDGSFEQIGYLSKELDAYRDGARSVHKEAFENVGARLKVAVDDLRALVGVTGQPYQLGLGYWLRCIESCQASVLLTERGMAAMPFATVRTAYECLFYACAIWRKPELLEKYEAHHHHERIRQANGMLNEGDPTHFTPVRLALLKSVADERKPTIAAISVWEAAGAADFKYEYEAVYRGCSLAGAHASVRSLDDFFGDLPDGSLVLRLEPDVKNLEWLLGMVSNCLEGGIQRQREAHRKFSAP